IRSYNQCLVIRARLLLPFRYSLSGSTLNDSANTRTQASTTGSCSALSVDTATPDAVRVLTGVNEKSPQADRSSELALILDRNISQHRPCACRYRRCAPCTTLAPAAAARWPVRPMRDSLGR